MEQNDWKHAYLSILDTDACYMRNIFTGCGDPGQVTNAARTGPTSLTPGGTVTYTCNPGYIIQGTQNTMSATAICQTNQQWTTLPICVSAVTGKIFQDELMKSYEVG